LCVAADTGIRVATPHPQVEDVVVQGVIKSYDPGTGDGIIMCDSDLADYDLAPGSIHGSPFRMLRQGQRVIFDLDDSGRATGLRLGSEVDMGTPGFGPPPEV
jgi:CspA family cold shock protein